VTTIEQAGPRSTSLSSIGAFAGWGGVLYALTHLAALWGDEGLLDEAEACALRMAPEIARDEQGDVMAGAAGCLVCLLGLWRARRAESLLDLAAQCGERLLDCARPMERGLGWVVPIAGPRPLAGFSHGAAGISWALLQLAEATGARRYRDAALGALEYERSLYSAEQANWPDLRAGAEVVPGEPHFMCAWCHGAAGIALGRLDSLSRLNGEDLVLARAEAETAVRTTLASGFGRGHSLCHGDLGNLEALTLAAAVLEDPDLGARASRLAGGILADGRRHGWRLGLAVAAEAPGMMIGLAGIGHGLLRLAAPRRVPAVVRLAPPPVA
jgi:type 2 lantibiotic biosynthesis protein LanM